MRAVLRAQPLSAPSPFICLKKGSSLQPASKKGSPAQARRAAPGSWACRCLCKCVSRFVAAWRHHCADLAWALGRSLPAQARTHLNRSPGVRPVAQVRSRLIPHPAAEREAEPYRLVCLSPAGQGGPGSSGFRLRAGSGASAGGTGKKLNSSSGLSPTLLNERLRSGAAERRPPEENWHRSMVQSPYPCLHVCGGDVCRTTGCAWLLGCMCRRGEFLVHRTSPQPRTGGLLSTAISSPGGDSAYLTIVPAGETHCGSPWRPWHPTAAACAPLCTGG